MVEAFIALLKVAVTKISSFGILAWFSGKTETMVGVFGLNCLIGLPQLIKRSKRPIKKMLRIKTSQNRLFFITLFT